MSLLANYTKIDLNGAVVAVTGGARGIGRATAEAFIARGARVAIGDLDLAVAQNTADELGDHCAAFALDVSSRASFEAFIDETQKAFGPIDVLVNNAGVMPLGNFLDESDRVTTLQINVNFWGPINGMQTVLPGMIDRGRGHVVNVASLAGKMPTPGGSVYCGTKHAVVGLSASVRHEVADHHVSVSTVLPSLVHTDLGSGAKMPGAVSLEPEDVAAAIVDSVRHRRAEIVVPRWLGSAVDVTRVLPGIVQEAAMRAGGFHRRGVSANDSADRADYINRVQKQAADS